MQRRNRTADYHATWEDSVGDVAASTERKQRSCAYCGETGHFWDKCPSFHSDSNDLIVQDTQRIAGNYAIYECTNKVNERFEKFKDELKLPPKDIRGHEPGKNNQSDGFVDNNVDRNNCNVNRDREPNKLDDDETISDN